MSLKVKPLRQSVVTVVEQAGQDVAHAELACQVNVTLFDCASAGEAARSSSQRSRFKKSPRYGVLIAKARGAPGAAAAFMVVVRVTGVDAVAAPAWFLAFATKLKVWTPTVGIFHMV